MTGEAEQGTCGLCRQDLIRTADDCWHPHTVARTCPPEPASDGPAGWPAVEWAAFFAAGYRPGRPGRQHFIPAEALAEVSGDRETQAAADAQIPAVLHGEQQCDCPGPVCAGETLAW